MQHHLMSSLIANRVLLSLFGVLAFAWLSVVEATGAQVIPLNLANRYFGHLPTEISRATARVDSVVRLAAVRDTLTPFLHHSLDGRICWIVTYRNVLLDLPQTDLEWGRTRQFTFEILIDTPSHRLVRIVGTLDEKHDELLRLPPPQQAESLLIPNEEYSGWPSRVPSVSCLEALAAIKHAPAAAQEIIINLVNYTKWKVQDAPAWLIQLRGLPPHPRHADSVPEHYRRYWRYLVHAETGSVLCSSNFPQYVPDE